MRSITHSIKWTIVIELPNQLRQGLFMPTREEAEAYLLEHHNVAKHAHIVAPTPELV